MKRALVVGLVLLFAGVVDAATLSYQYGADLSRDRRELFITADEGGSSIWWMKIWVPQAGKNYTSHNAYPPGQVVGFKDLQRDASGSSFDYSGEAASIWSNGLFDYAGNSSQAFGSGNPNVGLHTNVQNGGYFEYTNSADVFHLGPTSDPANIVHWELTVRINAPVVTGAGYRSDITASVTLTNNQAAALDLWYASEISGLANHLNAGGLAGAFVNPKNSTSKPNVHQTPGTDDHPLYTMSDWYGSTADETIAGALIKAVVKDNADTQLKNMRPGLTFETHGDEISFYYCRHGNTYGSTDYTATYGYLGGLVNQPGGLGESLMLDPGASITMNYYGFIDAPIPEPATMGLLGLGLLGLVLRRKR